MRARIITREEYDEIVLPWWVQWSGYPGLKFEFCPQLTGICYAGGLPICSASIYQTDSPIVYIENVIADPRSDLDVRNAAIDDLISYLMDLAKKAGAKAWSAHSKLQVIADRATKFKMQSIESDHYWMTGEL